MIAATTANCVLLVHFVLAMYLVKMLNKSLEKVKLHRASNIVSRVVAASNASVTNLNVRHFAKHTVFQNNQVICLQHVSALPVAIVKRDEN